MHNLRLLSRPLTKTQVTSLLSTPSSKSGKNATTFDSFSRPQAHQSEQIDRFFQDHGGWVPKVDFFQDP